MQSKSEQERLKQPGFIYKNVKFLAIPVSPADTATDLQVVCFFDQSKNQNYSGGTEAVDRSLNGAIKDLRANDYFRGARLETLLLTPMANQIPAQKLLLLGLGDPETFSSEVLESVGRLVIQEAIKLNVANVAFAPSLKDAEFSSKATSDVSTLVAQGMMHAISSMQILAEKKLVSAFALKEVIFLAGLQHLENSQLGLKKALALH